MHIIVLSGKGFPINKASEKSYDCSNYDLDKLLSEEQLKVYGWLDSCVGNGPRCYFLAEYPRLVFVESVYDLHFPPDADIVCVDCPGDYAEALDSMKNLPRTLQPLTTAIFTFALVMFFGLMVCITICCMCLTKTRRSQGSGYYSEVPLIYERPPVVARSSKRKEQFNVVV